MRVSKIPPQLLNFVPSRLKNMGDFLLFLQQDIQHIASFTRFDVANLYINVYHDSALTQLSSFLVEHVCNIYTYGFLKACLLLLAEAYLSFSCSIWFGSNLPMQLRTNERSGHGKQISPQTRDLVHDSFNVAHAVSFNLDPSKYGHLFSPRPFYSSHESVPISSFHPTTSDNISSVSFCFIKIFKNERNVQASLFIPISVTVLRTKFPSSSTNSTFLN